MKIAYLINSTHNSGGMERVLANKANWLTYNGFDVTIITTDQEGKPPFFRMEPAVHHIDLGVGHYKTSRFGIFRRVVSYFIRRRRHKRRLAQVLAAERFDVVVSMFGPEVHWLPELKDGSRKVAEIHFSKFFRMQLDRKGMNGRWDALRSRRDEKAAARYDRFVVLTEEDKINWGDMDNMAVIHNAVSFIPAEQAALDAKRVISVGRLNYQKGYDMLLPAWKQVAQRHPGWRLDIFGSGEDRESLERMIGELGIGGSVAINPPTDRIEQELLGSSIYVLSSRYEGLPMVLLEAMSCGVPAVAFECKCGPRDIIDDGVDGLLVENGNPDALAGAMCRMIADDEARKQMGLRAAEKVRAKFSEETIMEQWVELFESVAGRM